MASSTRSLMRMCSSDFVPITRILQMHLRQLRTSSLSTFRPSLRLTDIGAIRPGAALRFVQAETASWPRRCMAHCHSAAATNRSGLTQAIVPTRGIAAGNDRRHSCPAARAIGGRREHALGPESVFQKRTALPPGKRRAALVSLDPDTRAERFYAAQGWQPCGKVNGELSVAIDVAIAWLGAVVAQMKSWSRQHENAEI
jgi:hypothetical protein